MKREETHEQPSSSSRSKSTRRTYSRAISGTYVELDRAAVMQDYLAFPCMPAGETPRNARHRDPVAAAALRLVQGGVRALDERVGALDAVPLGHADRCGRHRVERGTEPLGGSLRVVDRAVGHDHRELIAAETGEHVARAQRAGPYGRGVLDGAAAGLVPLAVVQGLEPVEVDHGDRERRAVASGTGDLPRELGVPDPPVREACQMVAARLLLRDEEPCRLHAFDALAVGHVLGHAIDPLAVGARGPGQPAPGPVA